MAPTAEAEGEGPELIRRAYGAWAESGELETLIGFLDPEIEWRTAPNAPEPGPHHGHDAIRRAIGAYLDSFEVFRPEVERILATRRPDEFLVIATTHTRGKGSGAEVSVPVAHLIRLRDGRIVRFQVFTDRRRAIDEFT
jgi:ketosteroid isomerase-like protein